MEPDEIMMKYSQLQQGKEPIRLLKDVTNIDSWSNVPPYMVMLLTQLKMLNDELDIDIIEKQIIVPYLNFRLSADGYAREQFRDAHKTLGEQLKPILAGMIPENKDEMKRK